MSNRLADLERQIKHRSENVLLPHREPRWKKPLRKQVSQASGLTEKVLDWEAHYQTSAQFSSVSRAFATVNYTVPGIVPEIAQPSGMSCWATVFTILKNWRSNKSMSISQALSTVGQKWVDLFEADKGLSGENKAVFIASAGLVAKQPQNFSVQGWEEELRKYGPIWVTTDEAPGLPWAIHARIITGIYGDGTSKNTKFKIIDPAGGRRYEETIATFLPKYEEEVIRTGYTRIQVVHWQIDAGNEQKALSFGQRSSQSKALANDSAGNINKIIEELKQEGVSDEQINNFLREIGYSYVKSLGENSKGVQIKFPGGHILEGWKAQLLINTLPTPFVYSFPLFINQLLAIADSHNVVIAVGPSGAGGLALGGGVGAGILVAPKRQIGFYGSLNGILGAIASIGLTMQVTIVHGGINAFKGSAYAVSIGGGELIVGSASALLSTKGKFLGVSFEMGVGVGLSPIEFYAQYQYTGTTLSLASAKAGIPLSPKNGGMSISPAMLEMGDIVLSTGSGFVSKGIRSVSDSPVSHAALYIGDNQIVEAIGKGGVVIKQLDDALADDTVAVAFRYPGLTDTQKFMIRDFAGRQIDKKYDSWGIVKYAPFALDRKVCNNAGKDEVRRLCNEFFAKVYLGTKTNDSFFCSELVVAAYQDAEVPLTTAVPHWVSPADLAKMRVEDVPAFEITKPLQYVGHLKTDI